MKTAIASILLSWAHGALAAPQAPGAVLLQFPRCQADACYSGIDKAFSGNKTLIAAYCTLYSTSENFSQRFTDSIISDCAERALNIDPSGAFRWPIRAKDIAKQCNCASGGDDSACRDDQCYGTMSRVFRGKKSHMLAYCSLRATPDRGEIEGKLFGSDTCIKKYNEPWGSGMAMDFEAIGRACDCVGRG